MPRPSTPDILIAGAGIIGLSLALEIHARGAQVTVLERDNPLEKASTAAAGMLAAEDPHNPSELLLLSRLSATLYPSFLDRLTRLSGLAVPFQTETTVQYTTDGFPTRLAERSLDPRQLATALLAAVRSTSINLREHTEFRFLQQGPGNLQAVTAAGDRVDGSHIVIATGAWGLPEDLRTARSSVAPSKGQMLRVQLPPALRDLREVHRREDIYIVPRTIGPQTGTALIGATVEHVGFDTTTHATDLATLRSRASQLLPALAPERDAPQLEAWAGLRPSTDDNLPVLGHGESRSTICAFGHGRNGILLAPATAVLLADLLEGKSSLLNLAPFSPLRFLRSPLRREIPK